MNLGDEGLIGGGQWPGSKGKANTHQKKCGWRKSRAAWISPVFCYWLLYTARAFFGPLKPDTAALFFCFFFFFPSFLFSDPEGERKNRNNYLDISFCFCFWFFCRIGFASATPLPPSGIHSSALIRLLSSGFQPHWDYHIHFRYYFQIAVESLLWTAKCWQTSAKCHGNISNFIAVNWCKMAGFGNLDVLV